MMQASKCVAAALLLSASMGQQAFAAELSVCNKLSENVTGLHLSVAGIPDAAARTGVLVPGACAHWTEVPEGTHDVHYILGKGDHVMLCSMTAKISGSAMVEISSKDTRCIR